MAEGVSLFEDRGVLDPVEQRGRWIVAGLLAQIVGVGVPTVVVLLQAKHDSVVGHLTRYTVYLAWREVLRSPADAALVALGIVLFVVGSVALARPFVRRRSTLLIAVPVAALVGILALGVGVLVLVALVALADSGALDWLDLPSGGSGRRRKGDPPEE